MAEWLAVHKITIDKPEIALIAEALGGNQEEAFGWWFRLYSYLDGVLEDNGWLSGMTIKRLSLLSRVPESVCLALSGPGGWLHENTEEVGKKKAGVMVKNWSRHNGQSTKQRAVDARRAAAYRARLKAQNASPKSIPIVG